MPEPKFSSALIDVHVHAYPSREIGVQAQGGRGRSGAAGVPSEFQELMGQGIERGVLINITPVAEMLKAATSRGVKDVGQMVLDRMRRRNRWTIDLARSDRRFLASVNIDPNLMDEPALMEEVAAAYEDGARGITLHPANQEYYPNDRRLWPAYDAAQRLGMVVYAQSGFGLLEGTDDFGRPAHFADALADFPQLTFVLAHLGWKYWDEPPLLASRFGNVLFDTSYAISADIDPPQLTDEEATDLIRAIGADRVLFGSDWPWSHPLHDAARIAGLPLSTEEQRLVFRDNARRLPGLVMA